jgi:hypothetical protein
MRYEKSERVQHENYCCIPHFLEDVIATLFSEDLEIDQVHIIADTYLTEAIFKTICQTTINDFEFDLTVIKFDTEDYDTDEYRITILNDGEVFVEPAIDKDAEYYDCDGFIFVESEVNEDAYSGNNRNNDVMIFSIDED